MRLAPLTGFTVAVTADRRADEQAELLRRRGARVLHGPTVRTLPLLADDESVRAALDAVLADPPHVVALLTGLGTRSLFGVAESLGVFDDLLAAVAGATVVARGPKAVGAALSSGLEVDWTAPSERGSEVYAHLVDAARAGARIAVQRDGDERPVLADALRAAGADVVDIPVYRWLLPEDLAPAGRIVDAVCAGQVDAVTFTSSPGLRNLFDVAGDRADELRAALTSTTRVVCVGPVCAETAASLGLPDAVQPRRARLGAMVQSLVTAFAGRALTLDGGTLVQGAAVSVDGSTVAVELTDRERSVLERLAAAGGAVVSKADLLRDVWGTDADEHAVEVTVGRLRRRLGPGGAALATVPRRGYRLAVTTSSSRAMTGASGTMAALASARPSQA